MEALLTSLQGSALSAALRASVWIYPLVNVGHLLGIAALIGPILILDAHLVRARGHPAPAALAALLLPAARAGLALAVTSGLLLFITRPLDYAAHPLFQLKLVVLAGAGLNIAILHHSAGWRQAMRHGKVTGPVRLAAAASMLLWLAVLTLGRWIGYR